MARTGFYPRPYPVCDGSGLMFRRTEDGNVYDACLGCAACPPAPAPSTPPATPAEQAASVERGRVELERIGALTGTSTADEAW